MEIGGHKRSKSDGYFPASWELLYQMHHVNCASEESTFVPLDKERYWKSGIQCKPEREREEGRHSENKGH